MQVVGAKNRSSKTEGSRGREDNLVRGRRQFQEVLLQSLSGGTQEKTEAREGKKKIKDRGPVKKEGLTMARQDGGKSNQNEIQLTHNNPGEKS